MIFISANIVRRSSRNLYNKTFVGHLISSKIEYLPSKYFVVFPGSRSSVRIWSTENFIEVSNFIYKKYQLTAIVCGGNGDIVYSNNFKGDSKMMGENYNPYNYYNDSNRHTKKRNFYGSIYNN